MSHWKIGVKILWKLKYGGQNSIFFSWNPWSKFYVPWKGGSKFYIFSQCLEKGGSKPRSLPTNFTEGVPPPGAKSSIKSCFGQNYECVYKVWCQTVALKSWYLYFLPDTPETTFDWDRRWNAAESRDSVHRSHPENSRPMTRPPRNHRITIIYKILHLCTVELTWTCTMQSEA